MQINDKALILTRKKFGESKYLLSLLTKENGKLLAYTNASRKNMASYEIGSLVSVNYSFKENSKYGFASVELIKPFALLVLDNQAKLYAITSACAIVDHIINEGEQNVVFYVALSKLLEEITHDQTWLQTYSKFELLALSESGFGLDLSKCGATEKCENLEYISPKTGAAISLEAGKEYSDRLFKLPKWLLGKGDYNLEEVYSTLKISEYFLNKHFFINKNQNISINRNCLMKYLKKELTPSSIMT
ncbi:MAG: DNA repair protein RecO [Sphingobacteriia bacterium]|nr:DNA repair protein RecO [Sphingobacteriia bacterium]